MFVIENFFQINEPFAVYANNANGCCVFTKTIGKGIRGNGIIDRVDIDGKYIRFPILLTRIPIHLIKALLPFADQQNIHGIVQQVEPCFFIIAIQRSANELAPRVLRIFCFIECFARITGNN